jgi:integrase
MRKALTAKSVEALKPKAKRYEVHDILCPGFSLRIYPTGKKVYNLRYRFALKQRRLPLGVHPRVTLAHAREKALQGLRMVDDGIDPAARRRQLSMRVESICEDFIRQYAKPRNRSWRETERILQREFVATYGQRDIREIRRSDILEMLDRAIERGATYQANRILANLRKLFNWACFDRGIVEASPVAGVRAPTRERARDRVLNDDEIKAIIGACRKDRYPYGPFVLLLLATAARRNEVAQARWDEVDFEERVWVIPAERSKNGKAHLVPLSDFALELLASIPRHSEWIFSATGRCPINSFNKAKRRIDELSGLELSGQLAWRFHDLRRSAASGMARLGVAPHVIEKVLNHTSSKVINPTTAIYLKYDHFPEKRDALAGWGQFLVDLQVDAGSGGNDFDHQATWV